MITAADIGKKAIVYASYNNGNTRWESGYSLGMPIEIVGVNPATNQVLVRIGREKVLVNPQHVRAIDES